MTGRVYVAAVWAAGIAGLASALLFDVVIAARIAFVVLGVLWLTATTVAFDRIRRQRVTQHREWMIRSYALALFIVTFEFWTGGLEATPLPGDVAYPLGVLMAWLVNLAVAEGWIRRTRCKSTARTRSDDRIGPRARIAV